MAFTYKVGDKVRVRDVAPAETSWNSRRVHWVQEMSRRLGKIGVIGAIGDVVRDEFHGTLKVVFDDGNYYWYFPEWIAPVEAETEPRFAVGDEVQVFNHINSSHAGKSAVIESMHAAAFELVVYVLSNETFSEFAVYGNEIFHYLPSTPMPTPEQLDLFNSVRNGYRLKLNEDAALDTSIRGKVVLAVSGPESNGRLYVMDAWGSRFWITPGQIESVTPSELRTGVRTKVVAANEGQEWATGRNGVILETCTSSVAGSFPLRYRVRLSNNSLRGGRNRIQWFEESQLKALPFCPRDICLVATGPRAGASVRIASQQEGEYTVRFDGDSTSVKIAADNLNFHSGNLPGPSSLPFDAELTCSNCSQMPDVCECVACEDCGDPTRPLSFCSDHDGDVCTDCCSGHDLDEESEDEDEERSNGVVTFFETPLTDRDFKRPTRKNHKRNPTKRLISAEIEVARLTKNHNRGATKLMEVLREGKHSLVSDGSLPSTGFEINTCPAGGDLLYTELHKICDQLAHYGAEVTKDCGYHVHIDARDFTYFDLQKLVRLYAKLEKALFAMVAKSRRDNSMASPCGFKYLMWLERGQRTKHALTEGLYGIDLEPGDGGREHKRSYTDKRRIKGEPKPFGSPSSAKSYELVSSANDRRPGCRYHALNLHSWFYRGTIEYRLHQGTKNAEKIANWGVLWAGILDYCVRTPESKIIELASDISVSPLDALLMCAPTKEIAAWVNSRIEHFGTMGMAEDEELTVAGRY